MRRRSSMRRPCNMRRCSSPSWEGLTRHRSRSGRLHRCFLARPRKVHGGRRSRQLCHQSACRHPDLLAQGQWETGAARPASFFPQEAYAFPPPQPGFGMGGMQPGFPASMQPGGFAALPPRGPAPPGPLLQPAQQPLVLPAWNGPGQVQGALPPQAAQGPPPDVTIAGGCQHSRMPLLYGRRSLRTGDDRQWSGGAGNPALADQPPVDPMSFPPGLLPALVEENLRTEEPYAPLSKRDIDKAGIPRATEPDSYLLARLDRFYAELKASALLCGSVSGFCASSWRAGDESVRCAGLPLGDFQGRPGGRAAAAAQCQCAGRRGSAGSPSHGGQPQRPAGL